MKILLLESYFRLSSIECFIFKVLSGFLGGIVVIFSVLRMGEMLDFTGFYRSVYRSDCFGLIWVKCLGNADFTRGLWI